MKTILAMIFLGLFSMGIQNPGTQIPLSYSTFDTQELAYSSLTQQITQLISSNRSLDEADRIVALSFKVDKNSRISNIKVYTENEALHQHIILHLKGKQLNGREFQGNRYSLRIHVSPSQLLAAGNIAS